MMTRRTTFAAFAAALATPVLALAQGATVGPAGGVPSTTAPSNSAGTPAGGTGVISTTRVPTGAPMPATPGTPLVGGEQNTSETMPSRPRHHRRHRRHHHTSSSSTNAQ